ncbi:metallophosphoesterase family protein [Rubrivivax gelatinosus]|uniref:metallophosphoesterase family protein n=1 Tax=Rubrivivax gelatinosus TaxID=28068 RepID=UPI0012FD6BBE|nr:metallophosphoesterase [Rubrivivax gelatinosus]MBG6080932.1 putative phosphodiesterase [Rubrivivax gelatinosus]
MKFAFVSDLHAYHPADGAPKGGVSFLPANPGTSDPDPFGDLTKTVARESITADLVICGGDIGDKADARGFQYAWTKLNTLKTQLGASELVATCGNHDLDSRFLGTDDDPDPKGALQTITPQFPFPDTALTNQFWARNFAITHPLPGVLALVLNTSAYHGGASGELNHGRISKRTIDAIKVDLAACDPADLNILLCHHHVRPLKGLWGNAPDAEFMKKGGELLNAVTQCTASPWLVLHGHRHIPNLEHSLDPSCVVIGASSFSQQMQGRLNQFHILDVEVDASGPQPLRGTIESWSWTVSGGWQRRPVLNEEEGFPPICGFGTTLLPRAITPRLSELLGSEPSYMKWADILQHIPDIAFMTPAHFRQMEEILKRENIVLYRDRDGRISQIGRAA